MTLCLKVCGSFSIQKLQNFSNARYTFTDTDTKQASQYKTETTYGFELSDVFAVDDAAAVGGRQTETVHSKTDVQQLPHVVCAKRTLSAHNRASITVTVCACSSAFVFIIIIIIIEFFIAA